MRTKKPKPYDPQKQYNPGERAVYRGSVVVAERWTKLREQIANDPGNLSPMWRCSLCAIDGKECSKFCDEYGRSDKKRIFFRKMNGLKTLLYKKYNSNGRK